MEIGSLNLYNWRDFGYVWHLLLNDSLQLAVFADMRDPVCYLSGVFSAARDIGETGPQGLGVINPVKFLIGRG